mmetsp:Transcript_22275/g.48658  ORF Transcript_22275/g.48658 Transcript_22275/m.48658 type:complete len:186 (+) Transcript_22275:99-656(+)|eukprot:CAMPEP_0202889570 /NCGR_PEP_ID=MMETSP1392-20130828/155_1 /ASSEMBLY_ACC=CAM_ASM_000868 /TAXON_ID=225041 /ORGANISM="Chlamydomonas chlamydogama, Strain SAG 11-48b" /LENGTH=185 /DNA_ID=CAMNT_0049572929 /DNA_START=118 /DNA_END=675 /DNA_ORIENTATION=-
MTLFAAHTLSAASGVASRKVRKAPGVLAVAEVGGVLPRSLRARLGRVKVGERKSSKALPKSPASPNQEVAANAATGRVALGPWGGCFRLHPDANQEAQLPATLYLDESGTTHATLQPDTVQSAPVDAAVGKELSAIAALPTQWARNKSQYQKEPRRSALWTAKRGANGTRAMHQIMQARPRAMSH